jgi:hypothetical protein
MVNKGLQEGLGDIALADSKIFLNGDNVEEVDRFLACSWRIGLGISGRALTRTIEDESNAMLPGKLEVIHVE